MPWPLIIDLLIKLGAALLDRAKHSGELSPEEAADLERKAAAAFRFELMAPPPPPGLSPEQKARLQQLATLVSAWADGEDQEDKAP